MAVTTLVRHWLALAAVCVSAACSAPAGSDPKMAEKTAMVRDGWGDEVVVAGFQEERQPDGKWFVHDPERPQPRAVEPAASPTLGATPPAGAAVLFDGTDMSAWNGGPWRVADGYMEVNGTGNVASKAEFGDARVHVEFATPREASGDGQDRGNSGVLLMGRYEIQVLDSWKNATYPDGQCGAAYGQSPPLVNASRPPGEWQTYDITFATPRFDGTGALVEPARVTVVHNGVTVQDGFAFVGETVWRKRAAYHAHPPLGPLVLQDHGHPVRYRNIWVVPASPESRGSHGSV